MSNPAAAQTDFRDLKETTVSTQQEAQSSEFRLDRTYASLDKQAAYTAHECLNRYLANNARLALLFSGPVPLPDPVGGRRCMSDLLEPLRAMANVDRAPERQAAACAVSADVFATSPQCSPDHIEKHDPSSTELCAELASPHQDTCTSVPAADSPVPQEHNTNMLSPGVQRVELCTDTELQWAEPHGGTVLL